jgi:protoporphyrinogen oxidase
MKKILVLGAGIAGLAAAYELNRRKYEVEIIEAGPAVGGLASNFYHKGFTFDIGPHRIFSEYPEVLSFIKELGGEDILSVNRKSRLWLKKRFYQYPLEAKELFKHLPPSLWFQFGYGFLQGKLFPGSIQADEDSYEGYLLRRFGKGVCEVFFLPYARKVWGIPATEISADIVRVRVAQNSLIETLREVFQNKTKDGAITSVKEFYYPRQGIGAIAEALAARLQNAGITVQCNTKVIDIKTDRTLYGSFIKEIICETPDGIKKYNADSVISTIPLPELARFLQPESEEVAEAAKALKHRGLILACLMLRKSKVSDDHWLYFPEGDYHINRLHQPKNFSMALCPPQKSSLVAEMTCFAGDARWRSTDIELFDLAASDCLATGLIQETDIEDFYIQRIPNAYPIYDQNYRTRLNLIFQYLRQYQNLITTGRQGLYHHNNLDHSIIMGKSAAKILSESENFTAAWYDFIPTFDRFRIVD